MRYVVKVKCYFGGRLYEVGDTADFDSAVNPPYYFEPVEMPKKQETKAEVKPEPVEEVKQEPEKPKGRGGRPRKKNG